MEQGSTIQTLDPITKTFLEGVYDKECVLYKLNGLWHLLKRIMRHVRRYWKESVFETRSMRYKMESDDYDMISYYNLSNPAHYQNFPFLSLDKKTVLFPKPKDININMMPFIFAKDFKHCRLPKYLKEYWTNVISRCILDDEEIGQVCYLTIHESDIKEHFSQRRPGIHTERPGKLDLRVGQIDDADEGQGSAMLEHDTVYHHWGIGIALYDKDSCRIEGGIFMASNVADSCRVWDCQIMDDSCIGHLGDIEHLRSLLPESEVMEPNCLYWLTDRTPHESLPLEKKTYRQFFRLVTSQVSLWFEEHSTKSPLGVVPDPNITKIVKGSKFNKGEAYIA